MIIKQNASDAFYWLLPPLNHPPTLGPLPSQSQQAAAPERLRGGRSHSLTLHTAPLFNGLLCHYGRREEVVSERQNGEMEGGGEVAVGGGGGRGWGACVTLHNSTCSLFTEGVASEICTRPNVQVSVFFVRICGLSQRVGGWGWGVCDCGEGSARRDICVSATFCFVSNCFNFVRPQQKGIIVYIIIIITSSL